ncbi:MAG: TonB-dependent receptor [Parvibaculaceae bacterium]
MNTKILMKSGVCIVALATAAPAYAQSDRLETIVVTAQKREQNIQDVPIAVTAFGAKELDARNVVSFEEIARSVPGLQYEQDVDIRSSQVRIRGILGGGLSAGTDSSVSVYVDEVYLGQTTAANMDVFDLERLEVLRGPQGTLFGRNSLSGVVNVTSKRPSDEFEGYLQAEYGNYDHKRIKGRVSGAIIEDKLSASVSGVYFDRDGFLENATLGTDTNNQHSWGGRVGLYFTPTENIDWTISTDYRKVDQQAKTFETLINDFAGSVPGNLGGLLNTDPYDRVTYGDFAGKETLESWGISARGRVKLGAVDVVSVTGYRSHEYLSDGESDLTPIGVGRNQDGQDVRRFTQEIRLETTSDGPFQAIVGAFYLDQDSTNESGVLLQEEFVETLPLIFGLPPVPIMELTGGAVGVTETKSYAFFGNLTYDLTEKLQISLGARQTWDDKTLVSFSQTDFESVFGFPLLAGTGSVPTTKDSYSAFTPSASIRYKPSDDVTLYATASKGFRSGGFNDALGDLSGVAFEPETLWNYEGGLKSVWFDQAFLANISLFYMDWDNIQLIGDDPTTPTLYDPRTINAGRAVSQGVEVELAAALTDNFTIGANFIVVDAVYKEGVLPDLTPLDRIPGAADFTVNVSAEYVYPVSNDLDITLRGEYYRQGEVALSANQSRPEAFQEGYGLLGARLSLVSEDSWQFALWGKNLLDEKYNTSVFDLLSNPFVGQYFNTLGAPRTYGAEVRVSF